MRSNLVRTVLALVISGLICGGVGVALGRASSSDEPAPPPACPAPVTHAPATPAAEPLLTTTTPRAVAPLGLPQGREVPDRRDETRGAPRVR